MRDVDSRIFIGYKISRGTHIPMHITRNGYGPRGVNHRLMPTYMRERDYVTPAVTSTFLHGDGMLECWM